MKSYWIEPKHKVHNVSDHAADHEHWIQKFRPKMRGLQWVERPAVGFVRATRYAKNAYAAAFRHGWIRATDDRSLLWLMFPSKPAHQQIVDAVFDISMETRKKPVEWRNIEVEWWDGTSDDGDSAPGGKRLSGGELFSESVERTVDLLLEVGGAGKAAKKFVSDIYAKGMSNPFDPSAVLFQTPGGIAQVEMYAQEDQVHLKFVGALEGMKKGVGTTVMKMITKKADKEGITMTLHAKPVPMWVDDPKKPGQQKQAKIPKAKLVQFYKAHGFTGGASLMKRKPR